MGPNTRTVSNKEQLKSALKDRVDTIVITDKGLARQVAAAKATKKSVVVAALAGCGVIAANAWNPAGWIGAGLVAGSAALSTAGASVAITAIVALAYLGHSFMVMYNDYETEGKAKVKLPSVVAASSDGGDNGASSTEITFAYKLKRKTA